jgi:hypothetical protein
MTKFRCVCGHVLTTSGEIPDRDEWLYISAVVVSSSGGVPAAAGAYRGELGS